jgi:hypothetical protein
MYRAFLLAAMLALQLPQIVSPPALASLDSEEPVLKWNRVNAPSEAPLVAPGSDVLQLIPAGGDTLLAVVKKPQTCLLRSDDGGYSWEELASLDEGFVRIIECPEKAGLLYYMTSSAVYRSRDGGHSFSLLPWLPPADGKKCVITSISVRVVSGEEMVAASIASPETPGAGGVWLLRPDEFLASWRDAGLKSHDVYSVSFLPCYTEEAGLVAIGVSEGEMTITTMLGNAGWNSPRGGFSFPGNFDGEARPRGVVLAFVPEGAEDCPVMYVGINSRDGGLYQVEMGLNPFDVSAYRLLDDSAGAITSLHASAGGKIMAGVAQGGICYSVDFGTSWQSPAGLPTGEGVTSLFMTCEGYYASTIGKESAVSFSRDGDFWQQIAWIDTGVETLLDFAVSPHFSRDETLYLLTWGGSHSLWCSTDAGLNWVRCLNNATTGGFFEKVALSPDYGKAVRAVFVAGESNGRPYIWRSADGGRRFSSSECPAQIDCWQIAGDDDLFIGSGNGTVLRLQKRGRLCKQVQAGSASVSSIDVVQSPSGKWLVLAGDSSGAVYFSRDFGTDFEKLSDTEGAGGMMSVAFSPGFCQTGLVYAASSSFGKGIFTGGAEKDSAWETLEFCEEQTMLGIGGFTCGEDGLLYACDVAAYNPEAGRGKAARILCTPDKDVVTDTITDGLKEGSSLVKPVFRGGCLWAMDTLGARLLCFRETLGKPPELESPEHYAENIGISGDGYVSDVELAWQDLKGATKYCWQVCEDPSFGAAASCMEGLASCAGANLPELESEKNYCWRVRAVSPVTGPWSEVGRFKTACSTCVVAPRLESPLPGEKNIPVRPLFQWEKVKGAECYELVISQDPDFSEVVVTCCGEQALNANAWQANRQLENETGYFWRVRAVDAGGTSDWSGVGSFRTVSVPDGKEVPATTPPVITVILPVEPSVNIEDITVIVPPIEMPDQTIIITQVPGSSEPEVSSRVPLYIYLVIAFLGLALFVLVILLVAVITRNRLGN